MTKPAGVVGARERTGGREAANWLGQAARGTMHDLRVGRPNRDGETRKSAYPVRPADQVPLSKALNEAHSGIHEQMAAARKSSPRGDDGRKPGNGTPPFSFSEGRASTPATFFRLAACFNRSSLDNALRRESGRLPARWSP